MKTRISRYALFVFLFLICGNLNAATRVALVADKVLGLDKSPLVPLLEVELSKKKGIHLLERGEIDKILREQKISAANLVQRDKTVKAGQLLRVDAFVLLSAEGVDDKENKESKLLRVRLVETAHGLRLLDTFESFDGANQEDSAKRIADKVAAIVRKLTLPAEKVIPVGIVDIRRVELGERYQSLERILPKLLSIRLNQEPRIIMLEREDLKLLYDEKLLTQGKHAEFWRSGVLIDGHLRKKGANDLELELQLNSAASKDTIRFTLPVKPDDVVGSVNEATADIIKALFSTPPSSLWKPEREAAEFLRQGQLLVRHGRRRKGIALLETAHVLQPENVFYTGTLFTCEWKSRGLQYPHRATSFFCSKEDAIQYYTDIELAELVSLLVRQIRAGHEDGEPMGLTRALTDPEDGYFSKDLSVSSDEIRDMNRENRKVLLSTLRKAGTSKCILVDQAWTSSDIPEEVMANVIKAYDELIVRPEIGCRIQSPDERYEYWWKYGIFERPDFRITLFKDSSRKMETLWMEYLEELTRCKDPLVRFKSCLTLAEECWPKKNITKARHYCRQAIEILREELKTPNEPLNDKTKARVRHDLKRGVYYLEEDEWMSVFEGLYEPLIRNGDAHNLVLWDPAHPFSSDHGALYFESDDIAERNIGLLKRVLTTLKEHSNDRATRRQIVLLEDKIPQLNPEVSVNTAPVTMLLEDAIPEFRFPAAPLTRLLRLENNMLWIGFREDYHKVAVAGIDLKEKKIRALWRAKMPNYPSAMNLAIYENAIYLSVKGVGLVKFPGSAAEGQKLFENPEILTEKDGLPSIQITGMAQEGDKLWIGYGGRATEGGLGIYTPKDGTWETVLCSTLGKKPFDGPCEIRNISLASPGKLFFELLYTRINGLWKLDTKTHKVNRLWDDLAGRMENSSGQWWMKDFGVLMRFNPVSEEGSFMLGCQWWQKRSRRHKWKQDLFVPEPSMTKYDYNHWTQGTVDLSTSAVDGKKLWALLGRSRLIVIQRGKPIKDAEIMKNNLLNGKRVLKFFSTPYGLVGIGKDSIGLIEAKNNDR